VEAICFYCPQCRREFQVEEHLAKGVMLCGWCKFAGQPKSQLVRDTTAEGGGIAIPGLLTADGRQEELIHAPLVLPARRSWRVGSP
jgi:hypothetical protein